MSRHMGWEEARDVLRKMREEQVRDGQKVIRLWKQVLANYVHKLGDEELAFYAPTVPIMWTIHEQVTLAAFDCQDFDLAYECIRYLDLKFPRSLRVKRLTGMYHEAEGKYSQAAEIYKQIQEEDNSNMFARKREIAMLKEQNKISDAIEALNKYLEMFMTDFDAWMEMCDLYLLQQDYSKACFCMEELIMSNPHNHLFHQKYAEIKYTQGGQENLEQARAYYSQACKLNPNNMRAQFGLLLTASNLVTACSKTQKERQCNSKYAAWAAQQITDKYQTTLSKEQIQETKVLDSIEKILESLSAST